MIRIMVVDDAAIIRKGLRQIISQHPTKFEVCCEACNGQDAINKIIQFNPDVVITDVKMPKMDGFELIDHLSESFPRIRHIILSGYNDFELIRQGLRSGVVDYLLKPVDSDELFALLDKLNNTIIEEKMSKLKSVEMEKLYTNSMHIAMEQFYNHLLIKDKLSILEIESFMKKYEIQFQHDIFELLVINTDHLENTLYKQPMKDNPNLLDFAIKNLSKELIENRNRQCLVFGTPAHEIITVIGYPSVTDAQMVKDEVMEIAEDIRRAIEEHLEHTVTIGVSGIGQGLQYVWKSYDQAKIAAKYRMFYGNNRVIHMDDITKSESGTVPYPLEDEKKLITFLSLRSRKNVSAILDKIFEKMLKYEKITPSYVYKVCQDILTRISLFLREVDNELSVSFEETIRKNDNWMTYDNIAQLKQWLNGVVLSTIDMLDDSNSGSKRIIYEAKKFVINNYYNNISLNTIADFLNISPQYFSELFKKETGENFVKYLTSVRIEKAKDLLSTPDIKTYEIAELVGYDSPTYFNKVFKKMIGVSPQTYRNSHFKKE